MVLTPDEEYQRIRDQSIHIMNNYNRNWDTYNRDGTCVHLKEIPHKRGDESSCFENGQRVKYIKGGRDGLHQTT